MITIAQVRQASDLVAVADLFGALGYRIELRMVDERAWKSSGVRPDLQDGWRLYHGCRAGRLDLFFLEADPATARVSCSDFVTQARKWNALARTCVVCVGPDGFSIHGLDSSGRVRRLDLTRNEAGAEVVERLNLLERTSADQETAGLFELALERESITRGFFQNFRRAVESVGLELAQQCDEDGDALAGEALLILSRMLFLYFVQQKGWLDGNRRFLLDHLAHSVRDCRSYFDSVLRPLFFGCLNTPMERRVAAARALGRIPYLNGGLFEPSLFEQRHCSFTLSNELMQDILEKTLERYSFCIDEGDESGVHIDPEMLGKVFESLMAAEERLATGSFYTPKPIVDAITRRAIITWCASGEESIADALCDDGDLDPRTALTLVRKLESLTIMDPACGSGAFLLSALQVIERLTRRLSELAGIPVERNLRQRIVERSLFAVDVKPQAVRLCELRLWLSIVSSCQATAESVEPLPNLDRNILQGNALLGPLDFLGAARREVYRQWSYALRARKELFDRYRHALPDEKPALCRAIRESDQSMAIALLGSALKADQAELERASAPVPGLFGPAHNPGTQDRHLLEQRIAVTARHLARAQEGVIDFFAFDLHFAHVFAAGGFDIVLGNPPWVRSSRIDPVMRQTLGRRYELFHSGRGFDQSDLCIAFWDKALELTGDGGVVAMLLPSKIATASYAGALRRRAVVSTQLIAIDDWSTSARDLFDADTFPIALTVRKTRPLEARPVSIASGEGSFVIPQNQISATGPGSPWQLLTPEVLEIVRRIGSRCPTLRQHLRRTPLMGVKTGANDRFFLADVLFRNGSVYVPDLGLKLPLDVVARCIRGRDVERWKAREGAWMILPPRGPHSRVPAWLSRFAEATGINPNELRLAYVQPQHFGIKVVWKDVSRGLQSVVVPATASVLGHDFPVVPNQTLYLLEAITLEEAHALAALLNSTVFNALVISVADRAKDWHYRYFGSTVGEVPIPPLDFKNAEIRTLARLSRRAHRDHPVSDEVDELVRRMYGLSRKHFNVLSEFLSRRLGNR